MTTTTYVLLGIALFVAFTLTTTAIAALALALRSFLRHQKMMTAQMDESNRMLLASAMATEDYVRQRLAHAMMIRTHGPRSTQPPSAPEAQDTPQTKPRSGIGIRSSQAGVQPQKNPSSGGTE